MEIAIEPGWLTLLPPLIAIILGPLFIRTMAGVENEIGLFPPRPTTLKQIRYFVAAAQQGAVSGASQSLSIVAAPVIDRPSVHAAMTKSSIGIWCPSGVSAW